MSPPGYWFGRNTPGSRWGGDSPDFIYRIIPIAHGSRYEIRARPTCAEAPSVTYALMGNTAVPSTVGSVDSLDLTETDGAFVITVDDTPAQGRAHHLQTRPGGDMHVLVRDALGDWITQTPNALRVRRLSGPDPAPPSDETLARRAAQALLEGLYYTFYCTQSGSGQAQNDVRPPLSSAPFGGMATQWGTKGNIEIADDEALIVTANSAGALFRNVTLCDQFFMSTDYWMRTSSFNHAQMAADEDGCFTYVVAHHDPGRSQLARYGRSAQNDPRPSLAGVRARERKPDAEHFRAPCQAQRA